ncbi:hypothetical protein M404DRAFT_37672, partial [Pisolithus tinctorius Marx 270]
PATILVDNQVAIRLSECPTAKPGHYLLMQFRSMITKTLKEERLTRKDITIRWIAGHMDIEGNELVDREAKLAAKRADSASPWCKLPPSLRDHLPCSISALKQAQNAKQKSLW